MTFTEHIINTMKQVRLENIKEVRENINCDWVLEKVDNHCEKFDGLFNRQDIIEQILTNDVVASCFAKDPLKQNLAEKECGKWIGVEKLPVSGKNCIRFTPNGDIVALKSAMAGTSKSADFKKGDIYYTQKYTGNHTGGAQDNQYEDVVTFLRNGSIKHKVGAIVDGAYWDNMGHRETLKQAFAGNDNVFIVSADDLKEN